MVHAVGEHAPDDFLPAEMLQRALRRWWLVFLLTLLGGLAGWLVYRVQPPVYEAKASLLTDIDFSNTGALTQFEEDAMMDAVGGVLQSNEVIDQALAQAGQQGITIQKDRFRQISFIERRLGTWELRVRSKSPAEAQRVANIWLAEGSAVLKDAYQHALAAQGQAHYIDSLEACLRRAGIAPAGSPLCNGAGLTQVQSEMQKASAAMAQDQASSRGILAGILLGRPQEAVFPVQPVVGARGSYVFAGAVIGFLAGFLLGQSGLRIQKWGLRL